MVQLCTAGDYCLRPSSPSLVSSSLPDWPMVSTLCLRRCLLNLKPGIVIHKWGCFIEISSLSIHPFIHPYIHSSIHSLPYLSTHPMSICPPIHPSIHLCIHPVIQQHELFIQHTPWALLGLLLGGGVWVDTVQCNTVGRGCTRRSTGRCTGGGQEISLQELSFKSISVILNCGWFCLLHDIWQCLGTFLLVTAKKLGSTAVCGGHILQCTWQSPKQKE